MTLSFPLATAEFWDRLPMSSLALDCEPQLETSGTGGGEILTRQIAPPLWRGPVALDRITPQEDAEAMALLDFVRQAGGSFMAYDRLHPCPALDPDGSVLGSAAPTIQAISPDRRAVRLGGLPPFYQLRLGDKFGVSWGLSPVRYGLHRISFASSADATGLTDWLSIAPALAPAVLGGAIVSLIRPAIRAMIAPGSFRKGTLNRGLVTGSAFDIIQTVR